MAKIRSFNKFSAMNEFGEVSTSGFPFKGFNGFRIDLDMDTTAKRVRRICKCGNVDDGAVDACSECGNNVFSPVTIRESRWHTYDARVFDPTPIIKDDKIVARFIDFTWDKFAECFVLKEMFMDILTQSKECYSLNYYNVDSNAFNAIFQEYVSSRSEWSKALALFARYPLTAEDKTTSYRQTAAEAERITGYYNILATMPGIDQVPENEFRAIYSRFIVTSGKKYTSIMDFYKQNKIPCSLSSIYSITGIPTSDLSKLDNLDPAIIKAISYALIHEQVTYYELDCIFRYADVDKFNEKAVEFADFFRRNIVKYGNDIWEAFEYIDETPNAKSIKDANLRKFINYAVKKGVKRDKAYSFADLLDGGQGIEALKTLIS